LSKQHEHLFEKILGVAYGTAGAEGEEIPKSKAKFWSRDDNGNYLCFYPELNPQKRLAPGVYKVYKVPMGTVFHRDDVKRIDTIDLSSEQIKVLEQVKKFWGYREKYRELNIPHKRGFLLYGEPGTGKTTILTEVVHRVIDMGGVAINVPESAELRTISQGISDIQKLDGPRPICFFIEDIDIYEDNHAFVNFLDGTNELDGVIIIATTNYIENIPDRLKNRPGRFDEVHRIVPPEAAECAGLVDFYTRSLREEYGEDYGKEIMKFAQELEGKTPAEIRGAIVDRYIYGEYEKRKKR